MLQKFFNIYESVNLLFLKRESVLKNVFVLYFCADHKKKIALCNLHLLFALFYTLLLREYNIYYTECKINRCIN